MGGNHYLLFYFCKLIFMHGVSCGKGNVLYWNRKGYTWQ